jgi:hypothetical protein
MKVGGTSQFSERWPNRWLAQRTTTAWNEAIGEGIKHDELQQENVRIVVLEGMTCQPFDFLVDGG